jgi:cytochrome P450
LIAFRGYVHDLLEHQRHSQDPPELVRSLFHASAEDRLSEDELVGTYVLLLAAGHLTTTNLIANGLRALLGHPAQSQLLRNDPSLAPKATEECLRYDTPIMFPTTKIVTRDGVELEGVTVPHGTTVLICNAAANRDPAVFPDPDVFDITRSFNDHLSFGFGLHHCIGAPIARLEATTVFALLTRRFPDLSAAVDLNSLEYVRDSRHRQLVTLPVSLGRDRAVHLEAGST